MACSDEELQSMENCLKIIGMIYKKTIIDKEPIYLSKLVDIFDGEITRGDISRCLERERDNKNITGGKAEENWEMVDTIELYGNEKIPRELYEKYFK